MTTLRPKSRETDSAHADFDMAVRPLIGPLTAYFARRLPSVDDAPDCTSEALVVLWRRRAELPLDPADIRPFAFGIARGILSNHRRGHTRRRALLDRVKGEIEITAAGQIEPGELTAEHHALSRLSVADRELLTLLAWDGLTVEEAAQSPGISGATGRQRAKRARDRLRRAMGD